MNRRALLFAFVTAALGMALVLLYHRRYEREVSGGARVRVLAALKAIPRGTVVSDEMLTVREVPTAYFEDRMVRETERSKLVGLRLGVATPAHQTLTWTDVVTASDDRRDPSSLVQSGNRAVAVRTSREDGPLALLRPGDYVDVISTSAGPSGDTRSAAVLLQRVLVLATSGSGDPRAAKVDNDGSLTLSLTVPEAQLLALAMEKGRIVVALRNPDDPKTSDRLPDVVSSAVVDSKERAQITGSRGPARLDAND
jgi:pilus assembly protein CpaB